ncbi:MAG: 2,3-bisphosphoglycerate-independent phosphoglycerate mutase [candidate division WS6 bacterium OLB20]|uniref:2,3-bisphosphoglycerate-independent phosphoglycerate mutase n=1 Tax=candidate division WS6 bacterium OLB20 TaxID=1617426 RepID=A0A136M0F3_9BACT|nr:MAG: 2,3-bisphosphoglycerate-independent phosphoglycerate mutase [candidate division WS6 bacterium OLB20]
MSTKNKRVILLILDGWGLADPDKFNAIDNADTPNFDRLVRDYPNTRLKSDGEAVGLSEGQFGTSEINHLTIGAGRVILQDLPRINNAIKDESFYGNRVLHQLADNCETNNSAVHLLGIVSDGGVHAHTEHIFAILNLLEKRSFSRPVFIHAFSDGRDVPPRSVTDYLHALDKRISKSKLDARLATLQGRWLLDRDRDWDKTAKAAATILDAEGNNVSNWEAAVNLEYNRGTSDEFFERFIFGDYGGVAKHDSIFFFHYRTDRQYQLTSRLLEERARSLVMGSFVRSSDTFSDLLVAFPREDVSDTLAEVLAREGKTQLHVTETEKYPHLTFFFNGEREAELQGETWKMFESNRFVKPHYNFEPSMQNFRITKHIIEAIQSDSHDFIVANLASADMVGHTGNYEAAVISAESVDLCLGKIADALADRLDDYVLMVTADHGNSEIMWDYEHEQPHTQHTLSPVPFILVTNGSYKLYRRESLTDIAPTVLAFMGVKKPGIMTGENLVITD